MPPGKPFPKVSDAQRAAFGAAARQDFFNLAKHLGAQTIEHLKATPDSVITQTLASVERDTGAVTAVVRGVSTLIREREAKQQAAAAQPADPNEPIDAEFVDEDPPKKT